MATVPSVTRCIRCGSEAVTALTYTRVDGLPLQAGVCTGCKLYVAYSDGLPPRLTPEEEPHV